MTSFKPIHPGFILLETSKIVMCELYYDILQPYYREVNLSLQYLVTSFFEFYNKKRSIVGDLKRLQEFFFHKFCRLKLILNFFLKLLRICLVNPKMKNLKH